MKQAISTKGFIGARRPVYFLVFTLLVFTVLAFPLAAPGQESAARKPLEPEPLVAPLAIRQVHDVQPYTGFIPPDMDLSHIRPRMPRVAMPLVSHFDWREAGAVTPVKNQGACGSCYAFASIANFESKVLVDGGNAFDFSENNAKECDWYGSSCYGGNFDRMAHLFSTNGTVLETCDPYVPADVACNTGCPYGKTLLDWRIISADDQASVEVLKAYLQAYGPIYTSMYAGNGDAWGTEFQSYDGTYTLDYAGTELTNHAVLIVGFDDDLPYEGGTGAWIVKNSWGTYWGGPCGYGTEGGYFTISYGSARIGSWSSFIAAWQDYDPEGVLFYYDEAGCPATLGYGNPTCWGLVKYTPAEDVSLERVEFWTNDATPDIDVYLYDDFGGSTPSNLLASEMDYSFENAGYHSIELSTPVEMTSGDDFYVVLKITNESFFYPMCYDIFGPPATGCCYVSSSGGAYFPWSGGDLGIRVRATGEPEVGGFIESPGILGVADVPDDNGGFVEVTWKRSTYDQGESTPEVVRYKVWRRRRETLPGLLTASIDGPFEYGQSGPAWELVGTLPATGACCYGMNAPTYCDSGAAGTCWNQFCVTAHTGDLGVHFDSPSERGYSVDNLGMLGSDRSDQLQAGTETRGATYLSVPLPNPGQNGFMIEFGLAEADWVQLDVYDIRGRRVASLLEGQQAKGPHTVTWDAGRSSGPRVSPGLYFLRLLTSTETRTVKLILVE